MATVSEATGSDSPEMVADYRKAGLYTAKKPDGSSVEFMADANGGVRITIELALIAASQLGYELVEFKPTHGGAAWRQ